LEKKVINSKSLLFNRKEYQKFRSYISQDADDMFTLVEEKVHQLHEELPFDNTQDKRSFIDDFIKDEKVISLLNLN
ncbi:MAG: RNA polymerase sigma factor, partial [Bacteroidota bacterium]